MVELTNTHPFYESEVHASLELIKGAAEPFMQPPLPYHYWDGHIMPSFDFAMERCTAYEISGNVSVNRLMVGAALFLHDAGMSHGRSSAFESDEAYSVDIAGKVLLPYGFNSAFIRGVQGCIRTTHLDAVPETPEEKLTCLADISNTFGPYAGFILNTFRYYAETCQTRDEQPTFRQYRSTSIKILTKYLSKDLIVDKAVDCDITGKPIYARDGFKNLERFARASSSQIIRSLGEHATSFAELLPEPNQTAKLGLFTERQHQVLASKIS